MDYDKFFTKVTRSRKPSALRELFDGFDSSLLLCNMAGGLPNAAIFPYKTAKFTIADGTELELNEKDMEVAMQYNVTTGNPELRDWVWELTRQLHDPPTMRDKQHPGHLQICMANGAQDCINLITNVLFEEGDTVLMERVAYSGFLSAILPHKCNLLTVDSDHDGIIPESLITLLSGWRGGSVNGGESEAGRSKIKALYCVPNGGNPTGSKTTLERRRIIYKLAQEYDFLIVEDDAYYFLEERPLLPSFLSMDTDGRVIRFDTFSKTVAPGLRVASICGPAPILVKIRLCLQATTQGCSGVSQMVLLLLLRKLGHKGYIEHCENVAKFYAKRRHACESLARKYLSGLVEWKSPTGGMFLWVRVPGLQDTRDLVMKRLIKRGVLVVTGAAFQVDAEKPTPYVRISFSLSSLDKMEQGFQVISEELSQLLAETTTSLETKT